MTIDGEGVDGNGTTVTKKVELWRHDPVECIKELFSNPAFKDKIQYKPRKVYTDKSRTERVYGEMWMGQWWWKTQVSLSESGRCSFFSPDQYSMLNRNPYPMVQQSLP